jgi:pimeloyl-ACP methyl ester carboxylesterase
VIAPDHLGFGFSDAPGADEFNYSFHSLTHLTAGLLTRLHITTFAMYVQDYGAPIGWRLALSNPESVWAIISQNGNAYEEGFVEDFWKPVWAYSQAQTPETEASIRGALSAGAIRWQYLNGVADPSVVSPDTWEHDVQLVNRPGNDQVQLRLFRDYQTNVALYPKVHEYFRASHVPLLAAWGRNDGIFAPAGAEAFRRDLPQAQIELLDGGHFLLESALDEVVPLILDFLGSLRAPASNA